MENNCGICNTACRFNSVQCMSNCKKWYHYRCVKIPVTDFRSMCRGNKSSWACSGCILKNKLGIKDSAKNTTINELETRISARNTSDDNDLDRSLTLAAEVGNALLEENNKLRQENHEMKKEISRQQIQHEEILKLAQDEIININNSKLEQEKILLSKIRALSIKVELGIKTNDELIKQNETDKNILEEDLKKKILTYKSIIRQQELKLNNQETEAESETVKDLRVELKTKIEIIRVLKEDLDLVSNKQDSTEKKC